jgi:molybdopterin/thiamine biosynthesis adenylyltransferase
MRINERSSGLIEDFDNKIFHILGCGAIGSAAATQLARMGADRFILYDLDKVEVQNVGVSYYIYKDITKPKVVALHEHLQHINPEIRATEQFGRFSKFIKPLGEGDVVILGFDSMDSRLEAAEAALKRPNKLYLLIDGRMGAEEYHQFTLKNPTLKQYKTTWYSDVDAEDEPCNAKATSYCSNMSGAFIANAIKKTLNNEPCPKQFFFTFPGLVLGKTE